MDLLATVAQPTGAIYAIGGLKRAGDISSAAYAFDGQSWHSRADLPTPRRGMAVTSGPPDARIYAVGGQNRAANSHGDSNALATLEQYDPKSDTWRSSNCCLPPMPNARAYAAAAVGGDGLLYVFGGQPCVVSGTCAPLSVVEAFDGARWATRAPMPTPRAGLTAALGSDGHVHVAGGWNERGVLNVMEVYDPSSDTWTAAQPMATARAHAASARDSNGRIIVIGGSNAPTADLDREAGLTTVEAFDGRNGSWAVLTPLPTPLTGLGASQGNDGRIYVIGGQNDTSFFREVMAYNP